MKKKCINCKIEKELKEFNKKTKSKDGRKSVCRDCTKQMDKDYYQRHAEEKRQYQKDNREHNSEMQRQRFAIPENRTRRIQYYKEYDKREDVIPKRKVSKRKDRLKREYGLTLEQFDVMLKQQNNKCYICGKEFAKQACIDHNHETGNVRKLLCHDCNLTLGQYEKMKKSGMLNLFEDYLKEHK